MASMSNGFNSANGGKNSITQTVQIMGGKGDDLNAVHLEGLLIRNNDIFQSTLSSEDYLDSLAPVIKDSLKVNGLSELIQKLNTVVKDKEEELTSVSLNSTQDIDSCIDSIDRIHAESYEMNSKLQRLNQALNKSVYELVNKKKNLIKSKEVNNKIEESSMVLSLCIQVLEITNKTHELIGQKKYFSALKLIDELTSIHLPKVESFSFAIKIYDSIPHLTNMIKEDAFENLSKWLSVNLERKILGIGEAVFENIHSLQNNWKKMKSSNKTFMSHKLNSPIESSLRDPSLYYNIFQDEVLQINLSTLYDAILVYQTLNESELLVKMYNREWLKKYNRIIYPITSAASQSVAEFATLKSLDEYLKRISGFFVMDKQINLSTRFQLRSNTNSDDLWNSYVTKLKPTLLHFLKGHELEFEDLNYFKDLIGNFLQIMENNNYRINEVYEILMILFKEYFIPKLIADFRMDFLDSIQSDHYMPLIVTDKMDYDNIMKVCWYHEDASFAPKNVNSVPVSFPFSEDYVHYCLGIRSLLEDILQFINEHYGYDINELNDIIINDIFEKVLGDEKGFGISNDLKNFIEKNSNNKEIISQSYTNLEYYVFSLYEVGKLINRRLRLNTGIGVNSSDGVFTLRALEHFSNLRKFSEAAIFKMVDNKIRELLETVEYDDWLPTVKNTEANFSIKDFSMFLENLFTSIFSNLPGSLKTLGLFRAYDFVAEHFLEVLKSAGYYNRIAIENFDLDIQYLESSMKHLYASHSDVQSDRNVALETTFTELRQCINLLLLENYEVFKNASYRMRNFDRIKFEDGMELISKMQDESEEENRITPTNSNSTLNTSQLQSVLSASAATKFAKFSSRFKKNSTPIE